MSRVIDLTKRPIITAFNFTAESCSNLLYRPIYVMVSRSGRHLDPKGAIQVRFVIFSFYF